MDITFLITTYHRQESCQRLVDSLQGLGNIVVVSDGWDYLIDGCDVYHTQEHLGKIGYWQTVNTLFSLRIPAKYYIMLPDDCLPVDDMVTQAIGLWNIIADKNKICLNLLADRLGKPCWTILEPTDMRDVYNIGWVDMCFLCEDNFFTLLGKIHPVYLNWNRNPRKSSGVGRCISHKFYAMGLPMYQVKESLVILQKEHYISQMKP